LFCAREKKGKKGHESPTQAGMTKNPLDVKGRDKKETELAL